MPQHYSRPRVVIINDTSVPSDPSLLGGKGRSLVDLTAGGESVPPFFVVTTEAFHQCLGDEYERTTVADRIDSIDIPPDLRREIQDAVDELHLDDQLLAVRSSAIGEDGANLSFAGQLESILGVTGNNLLDALRHVWKSAFSERVLSYIQHHQSETMLPGVAVIVQKLIAAEVSGVAFGIDPVNGEDAVVISAVYGLGEGLVSGELDADTYRVGYSGSIETDVVAKTHKRVYHNSGTMGTVLDMVPTSLQNLPALSPAMIEEVAALTRRLGVLFGAPQDVEWCIAEGHLYVLQSRPVTAVGNNSKTGGQAIDPLTTSYAGSPVLWDNSNIIESYSGVTTPLTFSFIREVYTEVYQEFCRILGVDDTTLRRNRGTFEMLGLVRGRVYYNLLNWYRMLALLPGYSINARFMEQMMGVRERLEETPTVIASTSNPYIRLIVSSYRLITNLLRLPHNIRRFYEHLNSTLRPHEQDDLYKRTPSELMALYRMLEESLLQRWRVPILNDFYTMIFFGLLKSSISKLCPEESTTLHNDLLAGEGGVVSTEPMRLLREISNQIVKHPELLNSTLHGTFKEFEDQISRHPTIQQELSGYLDRFGDRYVGELKLESITPRQNPSLIQTLLAGYVRQGYIDPDSERQPARLLRKNAEEVLRRNVRGAFRKAVVSFLLRQTRERVRNRENLRFERTRVFGVVRRIFLALGQHMAAAGALENHRDVFYLTKEEIFDWTIGASVTTSVKELAALRRSEFGAFERLEMPDRFITHGLPYIENIESGQADAKEGETNILQGLACCAGVVRTRVRVVLDPTTAPPLDGAILVAERTDPGWAPLFPTASGLLVERGSLLSHSAIVAREMGIPAIVAIPGLLKILKDGMEVEMDGAKGVVRIISGANQ